MSYLSAPSSMAKQIDLSVLDAPTPAGRYDTNQEHVTEQTSEAEKTIGTNLLAAGKNDPILKRQIEYFVKFAVQRRKIENSDELAVTQAKQICSLLARQILMSQTQRSRIG